MTDQPSLWPVAAVGVPIALAALALLFFSWKGRPFADGDLFRASRWSRGNRLFPTQVLITPTSVVHYTPQWVGKLEHSIHIAHVASVKIDTNLLFSDVLVETTGGASSISCQGHYKAHAVRMKQLIERYQTDYYRAAGPSGATVASPEPGRGAGGAER